MTDVASTTDAQPELPKIELWPAEKMRDGLVSDDPALRLHALAMTLQPNAALDDCVAAIVACVELSRGDAAACQLAAAALSAVKRDGEKPAALDCLVTLATDENAAAVRIFAAHGFAQLGQVPTAAWPSLAQMLFSTDSTLRQVALRATTPFATAGASTVADAAARIPPAQWTTEGLAALANSAGTSDDARGRIEKFVLRSLEGQALMPTGIAGYAALARLNPNGAAPQALANVAGAEDNLAALAAIQALGQMREIAKSAIPALVQALKQTENAEREEAICRALLAMKIVSGDVPLARTLQRIEAGPDRAVAAHCLLLSVHAKVFTSAAKVVALRYANSSDALKRVLDVLHHQLSGKHLTLNQAAPAL
jgi:hypothetical protein